MVATRKKGFTLIELLVVISIMGLLSSVVLGAVNDARAKARDMQRVQALEEIRKALTLYYHDYGYYPPVASNAWSATGNAGWGNLTSALVPTYIGVLPKDPANATTGNYLGIYSGTSYFYGYRPYLGAGITNKSQDYDLITLFETTNHPLSCGNKQWITHGGNNLGNFKSTVWCDPTQINGSVNLYADH
ncbi:MAG: hypothetical protein A2937_01015 [Candidatus Yonathbacteria bacterium RIFCSPLOWO2_01_FULL_47_33b]|uniref:Type II secretion system protein GspG C-terminal domain-containing protein n=1 Tax=Candidatus Yonathbacteria bacterium RIFCSPLOWO2_01_FULL_47_33b TaxID=1802727 RepID=A0A1G2SE92_9BACT|nr:MAG: hypothetical protein A2937_01015 [Candidatus Yonathbacteria bacterium RIFCSPLOWO2_01_FULL_47_33b]